MATSAGELIYTVGMDTKGLIGGAQQAGATIDKFGNKLTELDVKAGRFIDSTGRMREANGRFVAGMNQSNSAASKFSGTLSTLAVAVASALIVRQVIAYADAWTNVESKIRLVTKSNEEFIDTTQKILALSNSTRSSVEATAQLYSKLANSTKELGLNQSQLLAITKTVNQAFAVSGATTAEASAAITQLGQALGSGTLRGDELNSVLEQAPRLAQAIATELGVSVGQIRNIAAEGKITSDVVAAALLKAGEEINAEFSQVGPTFEQAFTIAGNNMKAFVGEITNGRSALADWIADASEFPLELKFIFTAAIAVVDQFFINYSASAQKNFLAMEAFPQKFALSIITTIGGAIETVARQLDSLASLAGQELDTSGFIGEIVQQQADARKASITGINQEIDAVEQNRKAKIKASDDAAQSIFNERQARKSAAAEIGVGVSTSVNKVQGQTSDEEIRTRKEAKAIADKTARIKEQAEAERKRAEAKAAADEEERKQRIISGFESVESSTFTAGESVDAKYQADLKALKDYHKMAGAENSRYEKAKARLERQYEKDKRQAMEDDYKAQSEGHAFVMDSLDALGNASTNAISGLLSGTMSVTEAMQSFANIILNQAVGALVEIGIQQVKNQILGQTAAAASVAAASAQGTAIAAAYAPAAISANIATFGAAGTAGLAGYQAALSAGSLMAVAGARQFGGPTDAGMYRVGENNQPEIYQSGGASYLISGDRGRVTPMGEIGSGGGFQQSVSVHNYGNSQVSTRTSPDGKQMDIIINEIASQVENRRGRFARAMSSGTDTKFKAR
ncbi:MAG: tape measure protein [Aeromonadaceae bacterium]